MLFIYYPKCSTCIKAKKWLDEKGVKYTARHIVEENPSYDELKSSLIQVECCTRKCSLKINCRQ